MTEPRAAILDKIDLEGTILLLKLFTEGGCYEHLTITEPQAKAMLKLNEELNHYRNTLSWNTTCHGCADVLDKSYEAYQSEQVEKQRERAERAEAQVAELRDEIRVCPGGHF